MLVRDLIARLQALDGDMVVHVAHWNQKHAADKAAPLDSLQVAKLDCDAWVLDPDFGDVGAARVVVLHG